jgi:hypothetical protein
VGGFAILYIIPGEGLCEEVIYLFIYFGSNKVSTHFSPSFKNKIKTKELPGAGGSCL